jgi:hypothetical protein
MKNHVLKKYLFLTIIVSVFVLLLIIPGIVGALKSLDKENIGLGEKSLKTINLKNHTNSTINGSFYSKDLFKITKKRIMLSSDTHFGGVEPDGIAADDIEDWKKSIYRLDPDYLFHVGDIVQYGYPEEFKDAKGNFTEIIQNTKLDRIWAIPGGKHDGLFQSGFYYQHYPGWYMGFYRALNHTSQWYTLKIGNNVFIMTGYFAQPKEWSSGNYGGISRGDLFNQNKINWLNETLAKWSGKENNIFILHHLPLDRTNIWSSDWSNTAGKLRFLYESKIIKDMLYDYPDVVAWISAHVHVDSNAYYDLGDPDNVSKGTIVNGSSRNNLPPHVHFIHEGNIWKEHGAGYDWNITNHTGKSSFANIRYFDLLEDKKYVKIKAWDVSRNIPANMTIDDTTNTTYSYKLTLPYKIKNITSPLEYEQAWDVYRYSDEGNYQWYLDSEGLRCDKNAWIESRWDFWQVKNFNNISFIVNTSHANRLDHKIYYSNDGMVTWSSNWYSPQNINQMPDARWVKVITNITTTDEIFIRDMKFK